MGGAERSRAVSEANERSRRRTYSGATGPLLLHSARRPSPAHRTLGVGGASVSASVNASLTSSTTTSVSEREEEGEEGEEEKVHELVSAFLPRSRGSNPKRVSAFLTMLPQEEMIELHPDLVSRRRLPTPNYIIRLREMAVAPQMTEVLEYSDDSTSTEEDVEYVDDEFYDSDGSFRGYCRSSLIGTNSLSGGAESASASASASMRCSLSRLSFGDSTQFQNLNRDETVALLVKRFRESEEDGLVRRRSDGESQDVPAFVGVQCHAWLDKGHKAGAILGSLRGLARSGVQFRTFRTVLKTLETLLDEVADDESAPSSPDSRQPLQPYWHHRPASPASRNPARQTPPILDIVDPAEDVFTPLLPSSASKSSQPTPPKPSPTLTPGSLGRPTGMSVVKRSEIRSPRKVTPKKSHSQTQWESLAKFWRSKEEQGLAESARRKGHVSSTSKRGSSNTPSVHRRNSSGRSGSSGDGWDKVVSAGVDMWDVLDQVGNVGDGESKKKEIARTARAAREAREARERRIKERERAEAKLQEEREAKLKAEKQAKLKAEKEAKTAKERAEKAKRDREKEEEEQRERDKALVRGEPIDMWDVLERMGNVDVEERGKQSHLREKQRAKRRTKRTRGNTVSKVGGQTKRVKPPEKVLSAVLLACYQAEWPLDKDCPMYKEGGVWNLGGGCSEVHIKLSYRKGQVALAREASGIWSELRHFLQNVKRQGRARDPRTVVDQMDDPASVETEQVESLWQFFFMTALAVRIQHPHLGWECEDDQQDEFTPEEAEDSRQLSIRELYLRGVKEHVPFYEFNGWITQQLNMAFLLKTKRHQLSTWASRSVDLGNNNDSLMSLRDARIAAMKVTGMHNARK